MIIDILKNCHKYYGLSSGLEKAFEYLKTTDLKSIPVGRYEIDGNKVVALVQEYKTKIEDDDQSWELHKYHIDIQYIISGAERIGYYPVEGMKPSKPYDKKNDYQHLEDVDGDYLTLKDDRVIIIFPDDGHRPNMAKGEQPESVKKVVIKVLV